jgi:hypothetical protein
MIKEKKTPLDLMDDIYGLAYWMTGSEKAASELLKRTYLKADIQCSEAELLRIFRICYFDSIGQESTYGFTETLDQSEESLTRSLWKWFEDIKFTVLLSEISGMNHRDISEITGNSLETIRLWLSWGRKQIINGNFFNYPLLSKAESDIEKNALTHLEYTLIGD